MSDVGSTAEKDATRPATADDVIVEVENRLRSYSHPEDARRIALLHIEAYREGRARVRVTPPGVHPWPCAAELDGRERCTCPTPPAKTRPEEQR